MASKEDDDPDIVEVLLEAGVDKEARDEVRRLFILFHSKGIHPSPFQPFTYYPFLSYTLHWFQYKSSYPFSRIKITPYLPSPSTSWHLYSKTQFTQLYRLSLRARADTSAPIYYLILVWSVVPMPISSTCKHPCEYHSIKYRTLVCACVLLVLHRAVRQLWIGPFSTATLKRPPSFSEFSTKRPFVWMGKVAIATWRDGAATMIYGRSTKKNWRI